MTRFHGRVGYSEGQAEVRPDSWADVIVERSYYGKEVRASRSLRPGDQLNDDLSTGTSISIVGDAYAHEHVFDMRYIVWQGVFWTVVDVEIERPRLILRLGEVYSGPKAAAE